MKRTLSLLAAAACFCGGEVAAQETVEIQYTKGGVSRTITRDRDIEELDLSSRRLTSITLPRGLTNLWYLDLHENQLTSFTLPRGLTNLWYLDLFRNRLTSFTLPRGLTNLWYLDLSENRLTSFTLPEELTNLTTLNLHENQLTNFTLPGELANWERLNLTGNRLASLTLPNGGTNLESLNLQNNQLTSFTLPEGLANLTSLDLRNNQLLTSLTLARDTAERFAGVDASRGFSAYNLKVQYEYDPLKVPLKVILPKRLEGKVSFDGISHDQLEFLFLEDLDLRSPRITRAGDALEITWAVGVLQTSADIEGHWKDVRASSPLRIFPRPSIPAEFFRVRPE